MVEQATYNHAYSAFEKEMSELRNPEGIQEIRMAADMYDWLSKIHRSKQRFVPIGFGNNDLLYVVEGYQLKIIRDEELDKGWKVIRLIEKPTHEDQESYHLAFAMLAKEVSNKELSELVRIEKVYMAPDMYDWVKKHKYNDGARPVALHVDSWVIPVRRSNVLTEGWEYRKKPEYKPKELKQVSKVNLLNVSINGLKLIKNTTVTLDIQDEQTAWSYYIQGDVIVEPHGTVDGYVLYGMVHNMLTKEKIDAEKTPLLTIIGTSEYEPWKTFRLECFLNSYSTEAAGSVGQPKLTRAVFRIKDINTDVDEEKLPKVKLEVTEKDAEFLRGALTYVWQDYKSDTEESKKATRLDEYIRSQSKAVK